MQWILVYELTQAKTCLRLAKLRQILESRLNIVDKWNWSCTGNGGQLPTSNRGLSQSHLIPENIPTTVPPSQGMTVSSLSTSITRSSISSVPRTNVNRTTLTRKSDLHRNDFDWSGCMVTGVGTGEQTSTFCPRGRLVTGLLCDDKHCGYSLVMTNIVMTNIVMTNYRRWFTQWQPPWCFFIAANEVNATSLVTQRRFSLSPFSLLFRLCLWSTPLWHRFNLYDKVRCLAVHPNRLTVASGQGSSCYRRDGCALVFVWNSVSFDIIYTPCYHFHCHHNHHHHQHNLHHNQVSLTTLHVLNTPALTRAVSAISFSKVWRSFF